MGCCSNNKTDMAMEERHNRSDEDTPRKYGPKRKHDRNFKGPIENRSCTDVICCIIFTLFIIAMIVVGGFAFVFGNPKRLLYPTDTEGNYCGTGDLSEKKNLFFFDLLECIPKSIHEIYKVTSCPTQQICVKHCPTKNTVASNPLTKKEDLYCKYGTNKNNETNKQLVDSRACAKYTLESTSLAYRCVPTIVGDKLDDWFKANPILIDGKNKTLTKDMIRNGTIAQALLINLRNIGQRVIEDMRQSIYWILAGFGMSVVASFLYILIMKWVADVMVWLTTYAVLSLTGYGVHYCFTEYKRLAEIDKGDLNFAFVTTLSNFQDQKETWLAGGIILATILAILLLLLLALRKRIVLAIELIKEGSKAITAIMSTLLFPVFPWLLQLITFGWFVVVLAFLTTSGTQEFKQVVNGTVLDIVCKRVHQISHLIVPDKNITCNFQKYNTRDNILRLQIFHLFGWFWVMNFIVAFGQCVLAGAFASWYWAWDKRDVPTLPLLNSVGRTLRYHTGSLAFGSLIIALIQIIRAALEYLEYKLTGPGREPGPVARFVLKCLKCCFWCLEKFMKFLNKNAYIEIAVYGKNFCTSAKNAFFLLMRNILRVAVLDKVTDFLLFIGKLTITIGAGVASFQFFKSEKNLNYYQAPVIIIVIGAWFVATAFFGVYEMAINTVFLCFLEDSERHDGSPEKPYYMSKKMRKILGKKNKVQEDED